MKLIIVCFTLLFLFSCEDSLTDDSGPKTPVEHAFELYKNKLYIDAEVAFLDLLNDSIVVAKDTLYSGLGLTEIKLLKFEEASLHLDTAISLNERLLYARYGKLTLNYSYFQDYKQVKVLGDLILESDSLWSFKYDNTMNYKDVYLHIALSEFQLKNFQSSYQYTKRISTTELDSTSNDFVYELAILLNELTIIYQIF